MCLNKNGGEKRDEAMKVKINAEVVDANDNSRKLISIDTICDCVMIHDDDIIRDQIIALVEKLVQWIPGMFRGIESCGMGDVVWDGHKATIQVALQKRKSALQTECPLYKDMNKECPPEKFIVMDVSYGE